MYFTNSPPPKSIGIIDVEELEAEEEEANILHHDPFFLFPAGVGGGRCGRAQTYFCSYLPKTSHGLSRASVK